MRYFVNHFKGRNPENLFSGAATEQIATLIRVTEKSVNENIGVYENVSAGWEIFRSAPPA